MGNKKIKIILTASLALNLAFAATYVYKNVLAEKSRHKKKIKYETNLDLKKEQKEQIDAIIQKFRVSKIQFKQDILEKRMGIIDELGVPELNLENIKTKIDELNELENRLNLDFVDTLVRITNILDAKQRLDFLYKLSENWFFIQRRHR